MKRKHFNLSDPQAEKIEAMAKKLDLPVSNIVRMALDEFFERNWEKIMDVDRDQERNKNTQDNR